MLQFHEPSEEKQVRATGWSDTVGCLGLCGSNLTAISGPFWGVGALFVSPNNKNVNVRIQNFHPKEAYTALQIRWYMEKS